MANGRDDTEDAAAEWHGMSPGSAHSEVLRLEVADIKLQNAKGLKWLGSKLKGGQAGGSGAANGAVTAVIYPRARPQARVEWPQTVVGTGQEGQLRASTAAGLPRRHLEVIPGDADGEGTLELELQAESGASQIARARVIIRDIWQVRQTPAPGARAQHLSAVSHEARNAMPGAPLPPAERPGEPRRRWDATRSGGAR